MMGRMDETFLQLMAEGQIDGWRWVIPLAEWILKNTFDQWQRMRWDKSRLWMPLTEWILKWSFRTKHRTGRKDECLEMILDRTDEWFMPTKDIDRRNPNMIHSNSEEISMSTAMDEDEVRAWKKMELRRDQWQKMIIKKQWHGVTQWERTGRVQIMSGYAFERTGDKRIHSINHGLDGGMRHASECHWPKKS